MDFLNVNKLLLNIDNIPIEIFEEIETTVNVYNLLLKDESIKEAKTYFKQRLEFLKVKTPNIKEKEIYSKVLLTNSV